MERLFERMSRQVSEMSQGVRARSGSHSAAESGDRSMRAMDGENAAMDVAETDDAFVVTVDLPGFTREDVSVRMMGQTLEVSADREERHEEGDEEYIRRERHHQSVGRSVSLPDEVDPESVTARINNGVLTVTVPRSETTQSHEIEIESE